MAKNSSSCCFVPKSTPYLQCMCDPRGTHEVANALQPSLGEPAAGGGTAREVREDHGRLKFDPLITESAKKVHTFTSAHHLNIIDSSTCRRPLSTCTSPALGSISGVLSQATACHCPQMHRMHSAAGAVLCRAVPCLLLACTLPAPAMLHSPVPKSKLATQGSTHASPAQKAWAAASSPASRLAGLNTRMGGQDAAPQLRAKWMRGSGGFTARAARGSPGLKVGPAHWGLPKRENKLAGLQAGGAWQELVGKQAQATTTKPNLC